MYELLMTAAQAAQALPVEAIPALPEAAAAAATGQPITLLDAILGATPFVWAIMILLVLASVFSWAIIVKKKRQLDAAFAEADAFEEKFWSGAELGKLYTAATERHREVRGQEAIFEAGFREFARLRGKRGVDARTQLEGAQRAMRTTMAREVDGLEHRLEFLANVGSISPYVGLLGTVGGILHAFLQLTGQTAAGISAVAGPIAEALFATGLGLFAAIPAVWAFNRFSSRLERIEGRYDTFVEEFSSILQRQSHADEP